MIKKIGRAFRNIISRIGWKLGITNYYRILWEIRNHQAELCTYLDDKIGRLEGFGMTCEDYYYIIYYPEEKHYHWSSCVGGVKFLRDQMTEEEYMEQERRFAMRVRQRQAKWIRNLRRKGASDHDIATALWFSDQEHIHPKLWRRHPNDTES